MSALSFFVRSLVGCALTGAVLPLLHAAEVADRAPAAASAPIQVQEAWVRATVPQQTTSGAYMRLTSPEAARLVAVRSPVAGRVEIHEMAMDGEVMRMRALDGGLPLPAGRPVELKPGGLHLMLMDLKQPLTDGSSVPLTLVVERAGRQQSIEVRAPARGSTPHATPSH